MVKNEFYLKGEERFGPITSELYSMFAPRVAKYYYDFIVEDVESINPMRMLDVGCGPGTIINMLSPKLPETEFYCVDPSKSMVRISNRRFAKGTAASRIHVEQGSSRYVPFEGEFDLILSSLSFHHWKDKENGLLYLIDRLSEKGIISIYDPYYEEVRKKHRFGSTHSLSYSYLSRLNFDGVKKSIHYNGELVNVRFEKDLR